MSQARCLEAYQVFMETDKSPRPLTKTISSKKTPYSGVQGSCRNPQHVGAAKEKTKVEEVKANYSEEYVWSMAWGLLKPAADFTEWRD